VVAPESVHLAVEKMFASKPKVININREAFDRGLSFIRGPEGKR
jgi:Pyruvate/2-oxoacid:ferredoxin oxidoreductase gamma subunit